MGAVSGDVNSGSFFCDNAADLASRSTAGLESGDRAWVQNKIALPEGPKFFFQKDSAVPVDNIGIIGTPSGVGRWLSEVLFPLGT